MSNNLESFHHDHLADLKKSGLSDETILESGIKSIRPVDINKIFGYEPFAKSCYEIPYLGTDYSRYKMFYDEGHKTNPKTGKPRPKYLQKKDSDSRLYIPLKIKSILSNPTIPLYITEGEKKCLKAVQEGINCIGLSGLWNWSNGEKELINDFNQIKFEGRSIFIVPDSDWLELNKHGYEKNLRQAVYELARKLEKKGANVFIIFLHSESEAN